MEKERARIRARLDHRKEVLLNHFEALYRLLDRGELDGTEGQREWLEKYCVGHGVQLCPGDFALGKSIGIDQDNSKVACDVWGFVDQFTGDQPPLDYIVTNYLEHFPNTGRILKEWAHQLRPGGVMAIVCRDTDAYPNAIGPLSNSRRYHCFDLRTLTAHLARVGLRVKEFERVGQELRVAAVKTGNPQSKDYAPVT